MGKLAVDEILTKINSGATELDFKVTHNRDTFTLFFILL